MPQQRKRKIINSPDAPPLKDRKIEILPKEAEEKELSDTVLLDLPLLALAAIVSNLSFKDQANFERTCSIAKQAVKFFWKSRKTFDYEEFTNRLFKMEKNSNSYPLAYHHIALRNLPNLLSLYSKYAIRHIRFQTLPLLTTDDLNTIVLKTDRSITEIFGSVRLLDLRDVCINFDELQWLASACPLLSSLKLTFNAVAMDTFPNKESEITEDELNKTLSNYIRNYCNEIKGRKYPFEYLQLLVSVHDLFRCLGELSVH